MRREWADLWERIRISAWCGEPEGACRDCTDCINSGKLCREKKAIFAADTPMSSRSDYMACNAYDFGFVRNVCGKGFAVFQTVKPPEESVENICESFGGIPPAFCRRRNRKVKL